ncbi:SOS response-associated peptidase [Nigerium sp.]|uniref:SOS response-associated peptidase n=1 Tax=Nigerium sp. TaxID=2042655 RepID=UPI00322174D8
MCGRFAASASTDVIIETFSIDVVVDAPQPTFNAAPTDAVPAVVERVDKESGADVRKLVTPRWGLVPSWSNDPSGGARMINARFETVESKPAFRKAFAARRCLIPADGYYEWVPGDGTKKQPFFIRPDDGALFVMAGLYEFWRPADGGDWLTTCTIITTRSADSVGHIHDRMPMTIARDDWASWLDPHLTDPLAAKDLLRVTEPAHLDAYPVATLVNAVRNDGPELIRPLS